MVSGTGSQVATRRPSDVILNMSGANHGARMFKVYAQLLLDSPQELCTLERVDVSDNGITAEPCTTLMAALSRHENLVALNLSGDHRASCSTWY